MEQWFDEEASALYCKKTFIYPKSVAVYVMDHLKARCSLANEKFGLMLDAGCGDGSALTHFIPYFHSVIGFDISEHQIRDANKFKKDSNVSFVVARENSLPAEDLSVDLVTSCCAAHYFHMDSFLNECKRVLKPDSLISMYSHNYSELLVQKIDSSSNSDEKIWISGHDVFMRYYYQPVLDHLKEIRHPTYACLTRYADMNINTEGMRNFRTDDQSFEIHLTFKELKGYFFAFKCYVEHNKLFSEENSPINIMGEKLKDLAGMENCKDEDLQIRLTVALSFLFSSKK